MYLQGYVSQTPSSLSTANTDHMFITTPTYNIISSIHVVGTGVILVTSCRLYVKTQVKSPINSQKLSNLIHFNLLISRLH
jgi:hypothetical protein